jgi:hypothetical protein
MNGKWPDFSHRRGLSFLEWLRANGMPAAQPTDYVPRRYLGKYLNWCYLQLIDELPGNITLTHGPNKVVRITKVDGGYKLETDSAGKHQDHG